MIPGTVLAGLWYPDQRSAVSPAGTMLSAPFNSFVQFAVQQQKVLTASDDSSGQLRVAAPVRTTQGAYQATLALELHNQNHTVDALKRLVEWAAAWIGLLHEQQLEPAATSPNNMAPSSKQAQPASSSQGKPRRLIYGIGAVVLSATLMLPVDYRISVPVVIEGQVEAPVVAPFDGFIQTALVNAGGQVDKGTVLAQLDNRELKLKQSNLKSQLEEKQKAYRHALAKGDRSQSEITKAQLAQAEASVAQVSLELAQTQLSSPMPGWVIAGDVSRSIGAPISKGDVLFKVSPLHAYRAMLQISERDIRFIQQGQTAELKLAALPEHSINLFVHQPSPLFSDEADQIVYLAEASLVDAELEKLRPGMEGIAKVSVGSHALGWTIFHHFVDWLRLTYWTYKL